jgi:hypothetical protein
VFALLGFGPVFPCCLLSLVFGMGMFSACCCILEIHNLLLDFAEVHSKEIALNLSRDSGLRLSNNVGTGKTLETKCILRCGMAYVSLLSGAECYS